jgi:hypothetical protein
MVRLAACLWATRAFLYGAPHLTARRAAATVTAARRFARDQSPQTSHIGSSSWLASSLWCRDHRASGIGISAKPRFPRPISGGTSCESTATVCLVRPRACQGERFRRPPDLAANASRPDPPPLGHGKWRGHLPGDQIIPVGLSEAPPPFTLSAVSLSDRSLSAATATIPIVFGVEDLDLQPEDAGMLPMNARAANPSKLSDSRLPKLMLQLLLLRRVERSTSPGDCRTRR